MTIGCQQYFLTHSYFVNGILRDMKESGDKKQNVTSTKLPLKLKKRICNICMLSKTSYFR